MNSIHSGCAAAFARHRGKTGTLHLLQEEIFRLEKAIESVGGTREQGHIANNRGQVINYVAAIVHLLIFKVLCVNRLLQ